MSTRIILHGGNANRNTDKNDLFYEEILQGVEREVVRILCIYFARPHQRWDDSYDEDQITFRRIAREMGREIETKLATDDFDILASDIADADVVFINGGMKGNLKDVLLRIGLDHFRRMVDGKTLVGISAGANILSVYYYSMAISGIREGTGLLPMKILTHYSEDEPDKLALLKGYGEDLPIIKIHEEEYATLEL